VFLGTTAKQIGSSPNAIASDASTIFVSLGATNELVLIQQNRVISRVAAGWYPTDVVPIGDRAYVIDGKGEGTIPNPGLRPHSNYDYIAAIHYGSIRELSLAHVDKLSASPQGQVGFGDAAPPDTIVRPGGPIRHVFFILKENRSYDQILGDVSDGNGDPKLTWFGDVVTPNQHVLAPPLVSLTISTQAAR
jgi:phospholipase C